MWASYLTKIPYIHVSAGSLNPEKKESPLIAETKPSSPRPASYGTWSLFMWPLVVHAYMAAGIVAFMISYVDKRDFNLEQRRPILKTANGSEVPWPHFAPLQTDITTALSIMLAVLRQITACWLASLSWRCAFFLMEEFGLRPRQLDILVSYGIYITPLSGTPRQDKRFLRFIIWALLLVVLPVHLSAPVLTGSIAWTASNPPSERITNDTISIREVTSYERWNSYMTRSDLPEILQRIVDVAAPHPFMAWGRNASNGALKRYNNNFSGLEINSTVVNVTLPYFTIQAIEWVDSPNSTLSSNELDIANSVCPKLNMTGPDCPLIYNGSLALIPDTPWKNQSSKSPSMITERRLMVFNHTLSSARCIQSSRLGSNASDHQGDFCWMFAWVTYSAGAAICSDCRVSSPGTVQNDTTLELQESYMTAEALRLIPSIISEMIESSRESRNRGTGATLPVWASVDDHVIGMLTRAYAGAWMVLTDNVGGSRVYTQYSVSPPATRAIVNFHRVYLWLALQSLITLSGALFLYIQAQSSSPLIGDITLAAFHLDSGALHEDGAYNQIWGGAGRKVELEGDYVRIRAKR